MNVPTDQFAALTEQVAALTRRVGQLEEDAFHIRTLEQMYFERSRWSLPATAGQAGSGTCARSTGASDERDERTGAPGVAASPADAARFAEAREATARRGPAWRRSPSSRGGKFCEHDPVGRAAARRKGSWRHARRQVRRTLPHHDRGRAGRRRPAVSTPTTTTAASTPKPATTTTATTPRSTTGTTTTKLRSAACVRTSVTPRSASASWRTTSAGCGPTSATCRAVCDERRSLVSRALRPRELPVSMRTALAAGTVLSLAAVAAIASQDPGRRRSRACRPGIRWPLTGRWPTRRPGTAWSCSPWSRSSSPCASS